MPFVRVVFKLGGCIFGEVWLVARPRCFMRPMCRTGMKGKCESVVCGRWGVCYFPAAEGIVRPEAGAEGVILNNKARKELLFLNSKFVEGRKEERLYSFTFFRLRRLSLAEQGRMDPSFLMRIFRVFFR